MNKNKVLKFLQIFGIVALLTVPSLVLVQAEPNLGLEKVGSDTGLTDWGVGTGGSGAVLTLITKIIKILLGITAAVAVLFIIIGGFQFITSPANPNGAKEGKETLKNAVIGLIIIVLSYVIVTAITSFVNTTDGGTGTGTLPTQGGGTGGPKPSTTTQPPPKAPPLPAPAPATTPAPTPPKK